MKKGFTLIELLAVIVILAIIALIATPIVLSIIEETKESAVLRSAEHYLSVLELSVAKKNLTAGGSFSPGVCEVQSDGNLLCDGTETLEVELSGEVPSVGTITFNNGKIVDATLTLSNKTITKDTNGKLVFGESVSICKLIDDADDSDTITLGDKYQCKVKDNMETEWEDGYYFYVLSFEEDGTTNLIMDRNICEDGSLTKNGNECYVSYSDGDYYDKGPVIAMSVLTNATSKWNNVHNLDITYNNAEGGFSNFKVTGKARLPYKSEVNDYDGTNGYLYNHMSPPDEGFLEEGMEYIDMLAGYLLFDAGKYDKFVVFCNGYISEGGVGFEGVRPVINVKL